MSSRYSMEKAVPWALHPAQDGAAHTLHGRTKAQPLQGKGSAAPRGAEIQAIDRSGCVRDGELADIQGSELRAVQKHTQKWEFHLSESMEGVAGGLVESKPTFGSRLAVLLLCWLGSDTVVPEHWHSTELREVLQSSSVQMLQPWKQETLNENPVSQLAFPRILGVHESTCMCLAKHLIKWSWVVIFTQLMPLYWQLLSLVQWPCLLFLKACVFLTTTCS